MDTADTTDASRTCRITAAPFSVTRLERELCQKFEVPIPTVHPKERMRRLANFANYTSLFHGVCAGSGEKMLQIFPPDSPFPIYHNSYWWSDKWDVFQFGREYDFSKPFFPQLHQLLCAVPHPSLSVTYETLENCDYINGASYCKNCYLIFHAAQNEDCYFSINLWRCTDCVDCNATSDSRFCYDCTLVNDGYELRHSFNCKSCHESAFLWNCISCSDCFACVNLRHRKYCFFNEQLTEAQYRQRMAEIELDNYDQIEQLRIRFYEFIQNHPQPAVHGVQIEHSSGDFINNCSYAENCFDCRELDTCANCMRVEKANNCMDYFCWGADSELMYSVSRSGYNCTNIKFCNICWMNCTDLEYCIHCFTAQDCFACVGLRNVKYCIFNKQYSRDQYFELKKRIIAQMKDPRINSGENAYGEFFPYYMAQFPYMASDAGLYFPLSKEQVLSRGAWWRDDVEESKVQATSFNSMPDRTREVADSIVSETFACASTGKLFRITASELKLYKKQRIPLPRLHWRTRLLKRLELMRSTDLYLRNCAKTGADVLTTYSPDSPWIVWDHEAYAKEMN